MRRSVGIPLCAASLALPARADEPRSVIDFVQYGAAFAAETRLARSKVCPSGAEEPCILGSGGGVVLRAAHRDHHGYSIGGAYEFSKQDASNILNLPILQQLRAEGRLYLTQKTRTAPFLFAGLGAVGYGNEWALETWGGVATAGVGVAHECTREVFCGASLGYRAILLDGFRDKAGQARPSGLSHFLAFEILLEVRTAYGRW
ncbi:MAG: hypothetical protein IT374_24070 [Polyangiaceae bacterium]|nr:hypothetical protein [Polyangiaceae bacterium]